VASFASVGLELRQRLDPPVAVENLVEGEAPAY